MDNFERLGGYPQGRWKAWGERFAGYVDTLVAAYLSNPGERNLSLDALSLRHFAHEMIPIEALIGKGKNQTVQELAACAPANAGIATFDDSDPLAGWPARQPRVRAEREAAKDSIPPTASGPSAAAETRREKSSEENEPV